MVSEALARPPFYRDRFVISFLVLLIAFIIWRSQWMSVPFYWDEAWVYTPAVRAMYANGLSLLPDAIDVSLSRGHPLLFHVLATAWAYVFGLGAISLHSFALFVSVALLISVFAVGRDLYGGALGLAMAALVLTHEGFLAQSGILLPELMLALWVLLALHQFLRKRPFGFILFASLALLTKESGLAAIVAFPAWQVVQLFFTKPDERKHHIQWLFLTFIPLLIVATYFGIQYAIFGWVFFPEHIGLLTWDLKDVAYKSRGIFLALFEEQGRIVFTYASTIVCALLWKRGSWGQRVIAAVLFVAAIKALWGRWPIPFIPEPLSTLLVLAILFLLFFLDFHRKGSERTAAVPLTFLIVISTWAFSALNFYTDRYLLVAVPIIVLGGCSFMTQVLGQYHRIVLPSVLLLCIGVQASQIGRDEKIGDTRLRYLEAILADEQLIAYCEERGLQNARMATDDMLSVYLTDTAAGYLTRGRAFSHVSTQWDDSTRYVLVNSSTTSERSMEMTMAGFKPLQRIVVGKAWGELRERPSALDRPFLDRR
jgi:hypothetical protein